MPSSAAAAPDDLLQIVDVVELQAQRNAEALAQRRGDQPGAGGRADQRERRQVDADRARRRPLADHQVELAVLHRRIEDLLDRRRQPVDLVDEQHVARLEVGEDRREVARLARSPARRWRGSRRRARARRSAPASSCRAPADRAAARGRAARARPSAAWMNTRRLRQVARWPTKSSSDAAAGRPRRRRRRAGRHPAAPGRRGRPPRSGVGHGRGSRLASSARPPRMSASSAAPAPSRPATDATAACASTGRKPRLTSAETASATDPRRRAAAVEARRRPTTAGNVAHLVLQLAGDARRRAWRRRPRRASAPPGRRQRWPASAPRGDSTPRIASATFGPTPWMPISSRNQWRSAGLEEAVEVDAVLAHLRFDQQRHRLASAAAGPASAPSRTPGSRRRRRRSPPWPSPVTSTTAGELGDHGAAPAASAPPRAQLPR